jgi:hypothetical protein
VLTSQRWLRVVILEEGNKYMSKSLGRIVKGCSAAAIAAAVSLVAVAPSSAATHRRTHASQATPYYDYSPAQSDYTAGQLGRRTDPTIVSPGAYGPPDPASCGGFHC